MLTETKDGAGIELQRKSSGFVTFGLGPELQFRLSRHFHVNLRAGGDVSAPALSAELPDHTRIFGGQPFSGYVVAGLGFQI
jgi:hypothetical protein